MSSSLTPGFVPIVETSQQFLDSVVSPTAPKSQIAEDSQAVDGSNVPPYASLTIDRLFRALVAMIESLQNAAAAQADRLQLLANWQNAYTNLIAQVPVFFKDGPAFGGTDDPDDPLQTNGSTRDDMNRLNSSFTEQLQNRRSAVADDAKSLQSSLNQTIDSVQNQGNSASGLLQQLSGAI